MDVATDLVEAFLRYNGYFTVSELPIQTLNHRNQWETLTDIDVLAIRFPGPIFVAVPPGQGDAERLEIPGIPLQLEEDMVDVIIGEVKQGEARFNPSIAKRETLFMALHPLAWLYEDIDADRVVEDLESNGICFTPARGGGTIRTRLVAFGQSDELSLNVIPMSVVIERAVAALDDRHDIIKSARTSSAAAGMLKLLRKSGFRIIPDS